jgi:hypothetical protein
LPLYPFTLLPFSHISCLPHQHFSALTPTTARSSALPRIRKLTREQLCSAPVSRSAAAARGAFGCRTAPRNLERGPAAETSGSASRLSERIETLGAHRDSRRASSTAALPDVQRRNPRLDQSRCAEPPKN